MTGFERRKGCDNGWGHSHGYIPFVVQTITIARNVHRHHYRMRAGYKVRENGILSQRTTGNGLVKDNSSMRMEVEENRMESGDMHFLDNATLLTVLGSIQFSSPKNYTMTNA